MSPEPAIVSGAATAAPATQAASAAGATTVAVFRPAALTGAKGGAAGAREPDVRARAAGYAAGWAAGARAAAEAADRRQRLVDEQAERDRAERDRRLTEALAALERAAAASSARTVPVLDEAVRSIHEAAVELATAVLGRELTAGEGSARAALDRALSLPPDVGPLTVRLHPEDLARVSALLDEGQATVPTGTELVADPALAPGDAISEFPNGYLDARIGSALERARRALLEES